MAPIRKNRSSSRAQYTHQSVYSRTGKTEWNLQSSVMLQPVDDDIMRMLTAVNLESVQKQGSGIRHLKQENVPAEVKAAIQKGTSLDRDPDTGNVYERESVGQWDNQIFERLGYLSKGRYQCSEES